jgi:hypothetical protein
MARAEHVVIVEFEYPRGDRDALRAVEARLAAAITAAGAGEFDGDELAVDRCEGSFYMYGPDAEALFAVVRPILAGAACLHETRVTLRFGPPHEGVPERILALDSEPLAPTPEPDA